MKALTLKSNYHHLYEDNRTSSHKKFKLNKVNRAGNSIDVIDVQNLVKTCQKECEKERCDYFVFYNMKGNKKHVGIYIIETGDTKTVTKAKEQIQRGAELIDTYLPKWCENIDGTTFHFMAVVVTDKLNMIKGEKNTKKEQMPTITCHLCRKKPNKVLRHIRLKAPLEALTL